MSVGKSNSINPRLDKEIMNMKKNPPPGISFYPMEDSDKNILSASIVGTADSPYERGVFQLEVVVTESYPFEPPCVRFITPVYHPNVDAAGRICLDLRDAWEPTFTIEGLLIYIQHLMAHPIPDDSLVPEIASQYKYNKEQFDKDAAEWTIKHACSNAVSALHPDVQAQKSKDEVKKHKNDTSPDNQEKKQIRIRFISYL